MELLLFHCQQIPSRVDGMQNTHHWSVIMSRVAMRLLMRTGEKQDQIIHVQLTRY